jgi:peptidoglycan/LPS O-acetylase OafA/YrhL
LGGKPTTAFIVTLIGAILWLLLGVALIVSPTGLITGMDPNTGVMLGAYLTIFAILTILGAAMLYSKPSSAHTWGTIIVVLSIIGGLNIIALIGGISARRWKPRGAAPPPPPPP